MRMYVIIYIQVNLTQFVSSVLAKLPQGADPHPVGQIANPFVR